MSWATYLLCTHPEVQSRLREEIRANLPPITDSSKPISSADIDHLPYLNAVCSEVLRFYPPVPLTLRVAEVDTSILGQFVPKGTTIILSPWVTNNSTELWGPDAMTFNPDRWMAPGAANSGGARSNYAFLTFLHGPRSCIGQGFAKAEFACLLASWVGRFDMRLANPDHKPEIQNGITARPKGGLHVRMREIEGW